MKARFLALALFAVPGFASAQVVLPTVGTINPTDVVPDVPNGMPSSQQQFATSLQLRSFTLAQNSQHLTAPVLTVTTSICGGTGATVNGTDTSGQVAEAASASTSCVLTFAKAFVTAPACFVSIDNVADTALKCATTTTAMTVTQTSASSNKLNYLVVGMAGG
jgi:hypothetical protein